MPRKPKEKKSGRAPYFFGEPKGNPIPELSEARFLNAVRQIYFLRLGTETASELARSFELDGFVLDAWAALRAALLSNRLPPPSVRRYFIEATEGLIDVEARHLENRLSPAAATKEALAALKLKNLVQGRNAALHRCASWRWRDAFIVRDVLRHLANGMKLDFAYDAVASNSLPRSTVVRTYLAGRDRELVREVHRAMRDGRALAAACIEVDQRYRLQRGTTRRIMNSAKR